MISEGLRRWISANENVYWVGGCGLEQKGGGSAVLEPLVRGGSFNFQLPTGVVHPMLAHIWHNPQQRRSPPFSSKERKLFELWLKKYTWLVYSKEGNFMYCKICMKALSLTKWARSFDMLVFKNTKWPTCVYILLILSPRVQDHMFIHLGLTPMGLGLVVYKLSKVSLQSFSR